MATLTPVCRIRSITDKDEIIVDVLFSITKDNGVIEEFTAGYAIVFLKSSEMCWSISFGMKYDENYVVEIIKSRLEQINEVMRKQRGYE